MRYSGPLLAILLTITRNRKYFDVAVCLLGLLCGFDETQSGCRVAISEAKPGGARR